MLSRSKTRRATRQNSASRSVSMPWNLSTLSPTLPVKPPDRTRVAASQYGGRAARAGHGSGSRRNGHRQCSESERESERGLVQGTSLVYARDGSRLKPANSGEPTFVVTRGIALASPPPV